MLLKKRNNNALYNCFFTRIKYTICRFINVSIDTPEPKFSYSRLKVTSLRKLFIKRLFLKVEAKVGYIERWAFDLLQFGVAFER